MEIEMKPIRCESLAAMFLAVLFFGCIEADAQIPMAEDPYVTQMPASSALPFSSTSHLARYKAIAGSRAKKQNATKSVYDHLPVEVVTPEPYAYGWFGAKQNPTWSRQFGYGRRHTQWSLK